VRGRVDLHHQLHESLVAPLRQRGQLGAGVHGGGVAAAAASTAATAMRP
jgi:hypothetical protein